MVTYYRIEEGYNSGWPPEEVWGALRQAIDDIQEEPQRIIDEVLRLEPEANKARLEEVAECYRKPVQDLTIQIKEEDEHRWIGQYASGGNPGRDAKESCRRAVCRLVLEEMHRRKMEINITVS